MTPLRIRGTLRPPGRLAFSVAPDRKLVFEERISEHLDGLYRSALRLEESERGATELVAAAVQPAAARN